MKDTPFIFPLSTRLNTYVYDVNTNTILMVSNKLHHFLITNGDISNINDPSIQAEVDNLVGHGYLSSNRVKVVEHPKSKFIPYMLEYQLGFITLQVTQRCNLRCNYCAYSGSYNNRTHTELCMKEEVAIACIDYVIDHSVDVERLDFSFYGGEPLLNFSLIKTCVEYIKNNVKGREYSFHITTNGTVFTDEILSFLNENNFYITISLDGDKQSHDLNRVFANSGKGTFDTIISNVKVIEEKYPKLLENAGFNVVMDTKNNFSCMSQFFTNFNAVKDIGAITTSFITDRYSKNEVLYQDNFMAQRKYEIFKAFLVKLNRFNDLGVSRLIEDYMGHMIDTMFARRGFSVQLPETAHHGGPCVAGVQRLFADVNGNFYPCERVSEESDQVRIGSVWKGIDPEKVKNITNIGTLSADRCKRCWNFRFCDLCVSAADDISGLSLDKKLSHCSSTREATYNTMLDYCMLRELGYDFTENLK